MRYRIAVAVATVLVAPFGATAFAQQIPQPPPQPPTQQLPPQPPAQPPAQLSTPQRPQEQPATAQTSPATIKREVKVALTQDGITATKVEIAFNAGTVTLTGSVYSKKDIAKAKAAAMKVAGVTSVDVSGLHSRTG